MRLLLSLSLALGTLARAEAARDVSLNLDQRYYGKTEADCIVDAGQALLGMMHVEKAFQTINDFSFEHVPGAYGWLATWKLRGRDGNLSAYTLQAQLAIIPKGPGYECRHDDSTFHGAATLRDAVNDKGIVRIYVRRGPFTDHRALVDDPDTLRELQDRAKANGEPSGLALRAREKGPRSLSRASAETH